MLIGTLFTFFFILLPHDLRDYDCDKVFGLWYVTDDDNCYNGLYTYLLTSCSFSLKIRATIKWAFRGVSLHFFCYISTIFLSFSCLEQYTLITYFFSSSFFFSGVTIFTTRMQQIVYFIDIVVGVVLVGVVVVLVVEYRHVIKSFLY